MEWEVLKRGRGCHGGSREWEELKRGRGCHGGSREWERACEGVSEMSHGANEETPEKTSAYTLTLARIFFASRDFLISSFTSVSSEPGKGWLRRAPQGSNKGTR